MDNLKLKEVEPTPHLLSERDCLSSSRHLAIACLAIVTLVYICAITVADPDLWGHTLYGLRSIDQGVMLEPADPFSFTAVAADWVNHEWLSEYYLGWLFSNFGNFGLWIWRTAWAVLLVGVFARRWLVSPELRTSAAVLTMLFAAIALRGFFVYVRPQLATLALFAVCLEILRQAWHSRRELENGKSLWLLVPTVVLWTNLHGGFVAGVAIIWLYAVGALFRAVWHPALLRGAIRLTVIAVVASWSTLINPYGVGLHAMLWQHLAPHQDVVEWEPLWRGLSLPLLLPLILVGCSTLALAQRWVRGSGLRGFSPMDAVVSAVCLIQAVSHRRHVALLTIAVVILLAVPVSGFVSDRFRRILASLSKRPRLAIGSFFFVLLAFPLLRAPSVIQMHRDGIPVGQVAVQTRGVIPGVPVAAVRFLQEAGVRGNLVTDYGWGQYVIWHLYPKCRVAFDGRYRTIYPGHIERDFLAFCRSSADSCEPLQLLNDYPTEIALLPQHWPVVKRLERDANWQRVYADHQAVVFLHRSQLETLCPRQLQQASQRSLQSAQWVAFPGTGRQAGLAITRSDRNHVSKTERLSRIKRVVRSTATLAREVQFPDSTEFIAR